MILSFPVETGKYRQVAYGGEQLKIPEKENKLYDFDPVKLELAPHLISFSEKDAGTRKGSGEFTHVDSKGRKWEVVCGQPFLKLKCFDKGKLVLESNSSWSKRLNNTEFRPVNDALDQLNLLYSYEFHNWPFPPTIFLKIIFDKKDNPFSSRKTRGYSGLKTVNGSGFSIRLNCSSMKYHQYQFWRTIGFA